MTAVCLWAWTIGSVLGFIAVALWPARRSRQ